MEEPNRLKPEVLTCVEGFGPGRCHPESRPNILGVSLGATLGPEALQQLPDPTRRSWRAAGMQGRVMMIWDKDRAVAPKVHRDMGAVASSLQLGLRVLPRQTEREAAGGRAQGRAISSKPQNLVQTQLPGPTPEFLIS